MLVLIGRDGSFTYIRGLDESQRSPPHKPRPTEGFETYGVLAEKDWRRRVCRGLRLRRGRGTTEEVGRSVTVRTEGDMRVKCAVPSGMDLSIFRVGENVKLYCISRENRDVLVKIQSDHFWVNADGTGEFHLALGHRDRRRKDHPRRSGRGSGSPQACPRHLLAFWGGLRWADRIPAMPIYEYVCMQCESHFEELVRNGEQPDCPECGAPNIRKQLSVFSAHGSSTQTSFEGGQSPRSGGCCGGSCGCG